jgi:hypothetical protein
MSWLRINWNWGTKYYFMSLFKYIERAKAIHCLIEKENTGSSDEFARRVGISRSLLMEHLREMREIYNAPIDFCRVRHSFYYRKPFSINIQISAGLDEIKGGGNYFCTFFESPEILDSRKVCLHS